MPEPRAGDISRMLTDRLESLLPELLPGGRRYGNLWRAGSLAGEEGMSLVVRLAGPRRGHWKEYNGADLYGDPLDLVARTQADGDFAKGLDWARAWLGLAQISPEERERWRQAAARRAAAAAQRDPRDVAAKQLRADELWRQCVPLAPGDRVDRYLSGRGLALARLGRAPAALRCHDRLWAAPGRYYPAMVALVTDVVGAPVGIHRTFLAEQDDGRVVKAPLDDEKRALGPCLGGGIKLWRGASGKAWRDMPAGETVLLGEGIEDLMSALIWGEIELPGDPDERWGGRPGDRPGDRIVAARALRAVCTISLSLMAAIELPPQVTRVAILEQRDAPGSPARAQLRRVIERFRAQGRRVLLIPPPRWPGCKDLNDLVRRLAR
jgi:hypothetical protein